MSYDSPAPQEEKPTETGGATPTDPAEVDPESGTDASDKPVDNPTG